MSSIRCSERTRAKDSDSEDEDYQRRNLIGPITQQPRCDYIRINLDDLILEQRQRSFLWCPRHLKSAWPEGVEPTSYLNIHPATSCFFFPLLEESRDSRTRIQQNLYHFYYYVFNDNYVTKSTCTFKSVKRNVSSPLCHNILRQFFFCFVQFFSQ